MTATDYNAQLLAAKSLALAKLLAAFNSNPDNTTLALAILRLRPHAATPATPATPARPPAATAPALISPTPPSHPAAPTSAPAPHAAHTPRPAADRPRPSPLHPALERACARLDSAAAARGATLLDPHPAPRLPSSPLQTPPSTQTHPLGPVLESDLRPRRALAPPSPVHVAPTHEIVPPHTPPAPYPAPAPPPPRSHLLTCSTPALFTHLGHAA